MKLPLIATLGLLAAGAFAQEPYTQLRATGPQSLLIAYRSR